MIVGVYPGSFDPVTYGHLDIIARSSHMVDKLIVAVLKNSSKSPLFSVEERVELLKTVTAKYPNVEVDSFSGLLVDYVQQQGAQMIIRGLRAVTDFEYELQMAQMNRTIAKSVDTMFLTTSLEYAYLSSSIVKEVAMYGGDLRKFIPPEVEAEIQKKYKRNFETADGQNGAENEQN